MTAFIDENQQFIDPDTSAPIVNGDVFFGEQGADPETVPITVFVDRGLTTPISQPVKTDASGRTTQKIFIPGRYSFKVLNSAAVQKLIDLDAGSIEAVGTTVLTSIAGANNITASADPVLTALVNGEQFTFTAVAINTDDMTLDIDGLGARDILFNFAEQMAPGFIQQDQTVNLTYNSTEDAFFWGNEGRGISILTNVAIVIGTDPNTITADGGPSVTGNVNNQLYSFKVDTTNDDKVTLKIGALTAVAIKNKGTDLLPGQLLADIIYIVSFNSAANIFEVVSGLPLSSPGPIGEVNESTIKGSTGEFTTSLKLATGQTITAFDNATLAASTTKVPTNTSVINHVTSQQVNPGAVARNIVSVQKTDTQDSSPGANTFGVVTGMAPAITITAGNKVLITGQIASVNRGDPTNNNCILRIKRGTTVIGVATSVGSRQAGNSAGGRSYAGGPITSPFGFLDSPGGTGPFTYTVELAASTHTGFFVNRTPTDSNAITTFRTTSRLTVQEVR